MRTKSILGDQETCYVCGKGGYLEDHHVFNSSNRDHSEKYGLKVNLCPECHRGHNGVHGKNGSKLNLKLKIQFQRLFEKMYGHEKFMEIFKKNYI
jgi:5-methylcytosine-specific restriction endonuclease McrA